ncbi:barstar family protein [Dyella sp.]|jgi:RNAse (barnase) inhibitor barstar|uniref:barstar family protein n=1 Tax=Dyella sp. TaxID=1869338 RepID=UPI002B8C0A97|nr:barstar family protein [Dyella sp.]HTC28064.1 barstar family protein [Dyella sp.]
MSAEGALDLTHADDGGVYFVDAADFEALATAAKQGKLYVCRADLEGCHDKSELLKRLAMALKLPSGFGQNWDALVDSLRDLGWLHGAGHALLLDHANDLRQAAAKDFDTLLGILHEAANFAIGQNRPFFAFLSLPEHPISLPTHR